MTARARLSNRGLLVVPKVIREAHGWTAGTEFEFLESDQGVVLQPLEPGDPEFPPITVEEFLAKVPKVSGPPITEAEIESIVLTEAARRFDETRD